jgi:hypothetical protein
LRIPGNPFELVPELASIDAAGLRLAMASFGKMTRPGTLGSFGAICPLFEVSSRVRIDQTDTVLQIVKELTFVSSIPGSTVFR